MKVRNEYNVLLESGELLEMFPALSGLWAKDRARFTSAWERNIEAIKKIDVNFKDDE